MSKPHYRASFRIEAVHPALPGHFPQRPVVPGVVLLDRVAAALAAWRGARIAALPQVKFLSPLLPMQEAELHLRDEGKSIHFDIFSNAVAVASGVVHVTAIDSGGAAVAK